MSGVLGWLAFVAALVATALAGCRWARVAQREHYLAGCCSRFALRWWTVRPESAGLGVVAVGGAAASGVWPVAGLATAAAVAVGPLGLSPRGRTSRIGVTRRLRTVVGVWAVLQAAIALSGALLGAPAVAAAAGAILTPVVMDAALGATAPYEGFLARRFVERAAGRLAAVHPTVVAITGSYGKTSTKNHVAHLVSGTKAVVATPASFNNRAGLARAVNENLAEGTEVFVAEMGTYGPGEIAELCRWCPPEISVITAVGPVHLERFGSEERILEAKSEILVPGALAVLNVDDPRLAHLADALETGGREAVRCGSAGTPAAKEGVSVERAGGKVTVEVAGRSVASGVSVPPGVQPSNLACAVAVARRLGVPDEAIAARLGGLPPVANRLTVAVAPSGVRVLDDTYNSNPAGARSALGALAELEVSGRRVLVTPGMVELGARQAEENQVLGAEAAAVARDLVVVGRTNRHALVTGWRSASQRPPTVVSDREAAVAWVRRTLGPDDAVLYENDLPDHYP